MSATNFKIIVHKIIARPAKEDTNAKVTREIRPLLAKMNKETVKN